MGTRLSSLLSLSTLGALALAGCSSQPAVQTTPAPTPATAANGRAPRPEDTEYYTPVPAIVTPGSTNTDAPSDALVLLGRTNDLSEWVQQKDRSPALWPVADGVMTVDKKAGGIETKRSFSNYQLHLEWRIPEGITGKGQARGNSGLFLAAQGPGDDGYELQILDSYNNTTYVNGQAGSMYKQSPPLVNAMRPPGQWQTYDVVWTAPQFNADGSLKTPAYVTAIHNGVLVQNHYALKGNTPYIGKPVYKAHGATPIRLQAHGDPSPPISFRNIWIRPLQ
ncbi:MAG TPA: DUF1080 domain-containing protein [Gemmatimonadaceae bacterium]|jgi:hypothetical protein|nr:DUF1080 domain-containing protein [Gemmatimonadaceae bacterium]